MAKEKKEKKKNRKRASSHPNKQGEGLESWDGSREVALVPWPRIENEGTSSESTNAAGAAG
jgi:hypothetical protein